MFEKSIRVGGEQHTSIDQEILYSQVGLVRSTPNDTKTFLPCDIQNPKVVSLTPIDGGATLGALNGAALFTTAKGFQLDLSSLKAASDLTAWAAAADTGTPYKKDTIVKNGTEAKAYICLEDHAAISTDASTKLEPGTAEGKDYWMEISPRGFLQVLHTAAGAGVSTQVAYQVQGYQI
jgi:hypothetical protein